MNKMTVIPHWLEKRAMLSPNDIAVQFVNGEKVTFQTLREDAIHFAKQLHALGVQPKSRISLLSNNSYNMVVAIHALSYLEVTVVLLNTKLAQGELLFQFNDSDSTICIYADELKGKIEKIRDQQNSLTYSFSEIKRASAKAFTLPTEIHLDDVFTIMYTSGTTGFPKGVLHTYGNHFWSATASALNLGIHEEDKWLATLPLFHVSGLSILIKSVLYGMPVHLHEKFEMNAFMKDILENGVTIVSVVTVMLEQLLRELGNREVPASLRCVLLGGGPAPKLLLERCKDKNIPVFQSYGMTETASQIVTLSNKDALRKIGSAGKPLFPAQLKIVMDGKEAAPNEVGEIVVKGPMVTNGYYNRDEANRETIKDGWLFTGDLGYVDDEGFLYVLDRRKDLIISGGENIYPAEVEGVLKAVEGIVDAGVIGVPDEKWGQVPVAFVVKESKDSFITVSTIQQHVKEHLAAYKVPKEIFFIEELPRNASKKLLRRNLQEMYYQLHRS